MVILISQMKQGTKASPTRVTSNGNTKATESFSSTTQTTAATSSTGVKQRETQEREAERVAEKNLLADGTQCSSGVSGETQKSSQSFTSSQIESNTAANAAQTSDTAAVGTERAVKEGSQNKTISTQTSLNEERDGWGRRRSALPITRRGQFFNDSYFEDTWKDYQDAVRGILARSDDQSAAATDDMTCYRRLRSRDMSDENQAISSAEDSSSYKVNANRLIIMVFC